MSDNHIECRVISDFDEIKTIAEEWRELQSRVGFCLFSCFDWFCCWWETLGKHKRVSLHVVTATINGRTVGILPLIVRKVFGFRILEWAGNEIFDYCSTLAEDRTVVYELWRFTKNSSYYDFSIIKDVHPDSFEFSFLSENARQFDKEESFYLNLKKWPNSSAWLKSRDRKYRRDIRYKTVRLEKSGPISFEVIRNGPIAPEIINSMIFHKMLWYQNKKKTGVFSNSNIFQAFLNMINIAEKQGKLFLSTLKCGDFLVAHNLGFIDRGVFYGYFTSYDPKWAKCSPGNLILNHAICWAIDNRLNEFDFMRGSELFKKRLATGTRNLSSFSFTRTFSGFIGSFIFRSFFHSKKLLKTMAKDLPTWAQNFLLLPRRIRQPIVFPNKTNLSGR